MNIFNLFSSLESKAKAIWSAVSDVFPAVQTFVQQVEAIFPAGTPGATKLAAVKSFLDAAWGEIGTVEVTVEEIWPVLSSLITPLVALYNTLGIFNHKSTTSTTTGTVTPPAAS